MWLKRKQMKLTKAQTGVIEWAIAGMQNVVDNPEEAPEFGYTESNLPLLHAGQVLDVSRCNESALTDLMYRIEYQMVDMASGEGKNATVGMCKRLGIGIRAISGYEGDPLAIPSRTPESLIVPVQLPGGDPVAIQYTPPVSPPGIQQVQIAASENASDRKPLLVEVYRKDMIEDHEKCPACTNGRDILVIAVDHHEIFFHCNCAHPWTWLSDCAD